MSFLIINDFFENPDEIRHNALLLPKNYNNHHPGYRTSTIIEEQSIITKKKLEYVMGTTIYPSGDCFHFQQNVSTDVSWIHTDTGFRDLNVFNKLGIKSWAAVIYLTPDASIEAGTILYSYKDDGNSHVNLTDVIKSAEIKRYHNVSNYSINKNHLIQANKTSDKTAWDKHTILGNVYNRCVIYSAEYFHESAKYFGSNPNDCRLIQVCFFETSSDKNMTADLMKNLTNKLKQR